MIPERLVRVLLDYQCSATLVSDIIEIMDKQPERDMEILMGRLEGYTQREIARQLGCSQTTVCQTIAGWDRLRDVLDLGTMRG